MDEAMGRRPSITPPVTIDSSSQDVVVVSPPSPREPQTEGETPSKRRREPEWVQILKQVTERDEEREKMCLEKEERREKEALEREERKDREQLEREEKRERERLDREEKREREWREWLVKRENENAEREERRQRDLLSLVETILKNK
ncbi:protein enabled homolog [Sebastes umbrosus]|uniref:protein enabled homolog n=1 Tax=Sebastes umbrosus TaxID=72105 RepID=UPI00189D2024|nr:protein enabled homolog [Sebastes umbrosus]